MRLSEDFSTLVPFYVVFQDETSLWWLRLLKPGFRHCYVLYPLAGGRFVSGAESAFQLLSRTAADGNAGRRLPAPVCAGRGCTVCRISQTDVPVRPAPWSRLPASNLLKGCLVSALGLL